MPSGGLARVLEAALRTLAPLPRTHAIVIALTGRPGNHFTQCPVDVERGVWVEAVSNEYVAPGGTPLTADQELLLEAYGYAPPAECPNHWQVFEPPVDWRGAAEVMALPLVSVYGGEAGDRVLVRAFPT